jgi:hypothetical protein
MFHEIRLGCGLTVIVALPIVLAHTEQIRVEAMVMSIVAVC